MPAQLFLICKQQGITFIVILYPPDFFSTGRKRYYLWLIKINVILVPLSTLRIGYDNNRKRYDKNYRVAVVMTNYIVVIRFQDENNLIAQFVTAYLAEPIPLSKILNSPPYQ